MSLISLPPPQVPLVETRKATIAPPWQNYAKALDVTVRKLDARPPIYVTDYGAKGDGVTDDSAAIQAAFDAVTDFGQVLFPEGEFLCSGVTIPHISVTISGVHAPQDVAGVFSGNQGTRIKLPDTANTYIWASSTWVNNQAFTNWGVHIKNIGFNGNRANQSGDHPMLILRQYRGRVEHCTFLGGSLHAILLTSLATNGSTGANCTGNHIQFCSFGECDGSGIYMQNDSGNNLADNYVYYCDISDCGGTTYWNFESERCAGYQFIGNRLYGPAKGNANFALTGLAIVADNIFDSTSLGAAQELNVNIGVGGFGAVSVTGNVFWDNRASTSTTLKLLTIDYGSGDIGVTVAGNTFFVDDNISNASVAQVNIKEPPAGLNSNSYTGFAVDPDIITPTILSGNQNNYAPTNANLANTWRLSSDASRDITGIAVSAAAGGRTHSANRILRLLNVGAQNIVLKDASGSSSAGNKFAFDAGDVTLLPGGGASLIYDGTSTVWRMI